MLSHAEIAAAVTHLWPAPALPPAFVYFLRLSSGALYIGSTANLRERLIDHATRKGGQTTKEDPLIAVLRLEGFPTFTAARRRESQLKHWSRAKKEALIRGDLDTLRELSQSHASRVA